jgi:hypothetical protein
VVARLQINITEVFFPLDLIKEIVDSGNWVPVSNCDFCLGIDNQCRVVRSRLSSAPA